ncbi:MAG: hypothetical protein M3O31_02795, partial [Acidobacteriota bacterium]|nr:hypothetical protein [Acidobacteriota bacterium]
CIVAGQPQGATFAGAYRLYSLNSQTALTFTPWRGLVKSAPPDPILLTVPQTSSTLATVPVDNSGSTDLYVAAAGGIFLFAAANQADESSVPVQILTSPLITSVEGLRIHSSSTTITLWAKTNTGTVLCSRCALGSQTIPSAWSAPMPIAAGVDQLATMLDLTTHSDVLFAHTHGQDILKLTQDPRTSQWRTDAILLPTVNMNDVVESYTYSTRIEVVDGFHLPLGGQTFTVTATSPCSFYVDDVYMHVSPSLPLQLTGDAQGSVTVVQHTRTLGAPCWNIVQGDGSITSVNPMNTPLGRMQTIKTGADLDKNLSDELGNQTPLVPSTVAKPSINAVAKGINQFVQTSDGLPQDGSLQPPPAQRRTRFVATDGPVWGMTFKQGVVTYYEGHQALASAGFATNLAITGAFAPTTTEPSAIEAFAGDIFRWLEEFAEEVTQFFVQVIDGVTNFFITLGDAIYTFVMACIDDVVHGIQFVFDMIEVGWEKLVQFVGFIFNWSDILRTHAVFNKIFTLYAQHAIDSLPLYRQSLDGAIDKAQQALKTWAAPDVDSSAASTAQANPRSATESSPQANYGTFQSKANVASAKSDFAPAFTSNPQVNSLLSAFQTFASNSEADLLEAYNDFQANVLTPAKLGTLTATQFFKQLVDILVGDLFLSLIKNGGDLLINVLEVLVQGVMSALTTKLEIPVLSWLYAKFTDGADLTFLDLVCLVAAIPATVIFKVVAQKAPFPDDAVTGAILAATDFKSLQQIYRQQVAVHAQSALVATPNSYLAKTLYAVGGTVGLAGAALVTVIGLFKKRSPTNSALATAYACSYLLYVGPDIFGQAAGGDAPTVDVDLNTAVAGIAVLKTFVDINMSTAERLRSTEQAAWANISPLLEAAISLMWEFPVLGSLVRDHKTPSNIVGFVGNSIFNLGGVASIGSEWGTPQSKTIAALAEAVCSVFYGAMMMAQGWMIFADT